MVRAVVLALLLALALPMGAAAVPAGGGGTATVAPSIHDIAILTLNGSSQAGATTASVDVSTAMAVQREAAASRLDRYALAERLDNTPASEDREALLLAAIRDVEIRLDALRGDERALRVAYASDRIDARTFVRGLARVHARAGHLRASLDHIRDEADDIQQFSLNGRIQLIEAKLIGYYGPVRGQALAASVGEGPPTRVAVTASEDGAVLAMLDGVRYVREAHRADQRTPGTVSSFSIDEAAERAFEIYPVAYERSRQPGFGQNIDGSVGGNLYLVRFSMPAGTINAYLDDGTRNVFYEVQERRVNLLGPRPSVTATANGTRLAVNRSYPGGPLQLRVADNATGEPLRTTVVVGDTSVETDADGSAWTLAPAAPVQVTAVGPEGNVTVSVRPLTPTSAAGEG